MIRLALFFILLAAAPTRAHDWYPPLCCSGRDCAPTGAADGAREPAATWEGDTLRLHDGKTYARRALRVSPDGLLHVCRRDGDPRGEVITVDDKPCIFAPGFGS